MLINQGLLKTAILIFSGLVAITAIFVAGLMIHNTKNLVRSEQEKIFAVACAKIDGVPVITPSGSRYCMYKDSFQNLKKMPQN